MPNSATGPGPITADGCAVELYRRLQATGEPDVIQAAVSSGATVLELGAGAGRVTRELVRLGYRVTAVDASSEMLAYIAGARTIASSIERLELSERFDAVVLGSNLINVPDAALRAAFLATCRRHVRNDGVVLIERYVPARLERLQDGLLDERDGIRTSLRGLRRSGNEFSATIIYEARDATWSHSFSATLLDDAAIAAELERAGLRFAEWLDEKQGWYSAKPVEPRAG